MILKRMVDRGKYTPVPTPPSYQLPRHQYKSQPHPITLTTTAATTNTSTGTPHPVTADDVATYENYDNAYISGSSSNDYDGGGLRIDLNHDNTVPTYLTAPVVSSRSMDDFDVDDTSSGDSRSQISHASPPHPPLQRPSELLMQSLRCKHNQNVLL